MKNFTQREYHPVIEDFVSDYAEDKLGQVERAAFDEVLVHDDNLRELAFHAKGGKELMDQYREKIDVKAREGFLDRLRERIAKEEC